MSRQRLYGIADGAVVGALPFWILAIFRTGERWPGWLALGVGLIPATTAFRTPFAWGLGVVAGAVLSWAGLAILVGTDRRLLPYVLVVFSRYYLSVMTAIVAAYWIRTTRAQNAGRREDHRARAITVRWSGRIGYRFVAVYVSKALRSRAAS